MSKLPPNYHIPKTLQLSSSVLLDAVKQFGTPLYVYDAAMINEQWRVLRSMVPANTKVYYAVKANPNTTIIRILRDLGASFQVASEGELDIVLGCGVSPSDIIFAGPGKTIQQLQKAIEHNLQAVVAESIREIKTLQTLSEQANQKTRVALRMQLGSSSHTAFFGMEENIMCNILMNASQYSHLDILGVHGYKQTNILDWEAIVQNSEKVLDAADKYQKLSGKALSFINIGGGFGIPYYEPQTMLDVNSLKPALHELIHKYTTKYPLTETIAIESGRFLAGPSGVFLTRVIDIKQAGGEQFAILDGGINFFNFFSRTFLQSEQISPLKVLKNSSEHEKPSMFTLCGPLCTRGDVLAKNTLLSPPPQIGDIMAFYQAGAYSLTASPVLFVSHKFPNEVIFDRGQLLPS